MSGLRVSFVGMSESVSAKGAVVVSDISAAMVEFAISVGELYPLATLLQIGNLGLSTDYTIRVTDGFVVFMRRVFDTEEELLDYVREYVDSLVDKELIT